MLGVVTVASGMTGATGAVGINFAITLFFFTGILTIYFYSTPVAGSFVVTSFSSSSTTGTTS